MSNIAQPVIRAVALPTSKETNWFVANWGLLAATAALVVILLLPTPAGLPVAAIICSPFSPSLSSSG